MSNVDIDELVRWRDQCEALAASLQRKDAERVISEFNGKLVWACSHCDAQSSSRFLPAGWETDEDDRGSIRHLCAVCAEREKRQPVQGAS